MQGHVIMSMNGNAMSISIDQLEKIGEKPGGSVPGGLYKNKNTGEKYIVKYTPTEASKNEILASKFYQAAGISVPDFLLVSGIDNLDDYSIANENMKLYSKPYLFLAVKFVENLKSISVKDGAHQQDILDGFIIDAWLGNYDVLGGSAQKIANILNANGRAMRIDIGASLERKAQGDSKGRGFNDKVDEVWFLLDINPETTLKSLFRSRASELHRRLMTIAGSVFKNLTRDNVEAGYKKLEIMTDDTIRELVASVYSDDEKHREMLTQLLIRRRNNLFKMKDNIINSLAQSRTESPYVGQGLYANTQQPQAQQSQPAILIKEQQATLPA